MKKLKIKKMFKIGKFYCLPTNSRQYSLKIILKIDSIGTQIHAILSGCDGCAKSGWAHGDWGCDSENTERCPCCECNQGGFETPKFPKNKKIILEFPFFSPGIIYMDEKGEVIEYEKEDRKNHLHVRIEKDAVIFSKEEEDVFYIEKEVTN